jgi:hypothetical protein
MYINLNLLLHYFEIIYPLLTIVTVSLLWTGIFMNYESKKFQKINFL